MDYTTSKNKFMRCLLIQGKNLIKANKPLPNLNRPFNASKKKNKCWQPKKPNSNQLLPTNKKYYILLTLGVSKNSKKPLKPNCSMRLYSIRKRHTITNSISP